MFLDLAVIGAAGFLGAVARYLSYISVRTWLPSSFPLATALVNITGCSIMGAIMALVERETSAHRTLYLIGVVGFLGSFTTFSTFGFETFDLIRRQEITTALLNIAINMVVGVAAVWISYVITQKIW